MEFKDYYVTLGVEPTADEKTIKTAYRRLARKYHPDMNKEAGAENRFKEVAEAYEVLSSAEKRAEYDQLRQYGRAGEQFEVPPGWQRAHGFGGAHEHFGGDFSDFFESIFGGRPGSHQHAQAPRRGRDIELELPVFLEETLGEHSKPIDYRVPSFDEHGQRTDRHKSLNVKIPAGVADGERIRLKGQGGLGVNGGPSGDLYLFIRLVPHPLFDVEGHDLILTVPLAPWEAALGARIEVPTLSGRIHLSIPPDSQSGQRLRIKGKGLKDKHGVGNLYAVLKVVMPPRSDEHAHKLWTQLRDAAGFDPRSQWSKPE
ncbi:curved DNA-binding protein [Azotobacter beijerinckii]|uniref:Curved DNA-binding protein n=1 Tax=Azotobacter beijerinckii TaxID=170623 RepID=A0A1H6TZS5_9GAMM|nr:curved DNA-binding protein [Azotobacter beijerinckii]SEI85531.1 curved DNA-binding protein [Azotobacter beijerinckii]SEQ29656.1 curved DNA-binding protein [Azotobacter beijerinckii]